MVVVIQFLDEFFINVICFLVVDVIEKVKFGYFGLFMGVVFMVFILWNKFMKFNFKNFKWFNWDCFVLFVGYGFMLQYVLFYLLGYDSVIIEDIKQFC